MKNMIKSLIALIFFTSTTLLNAEVLDKKINTKSKTPTKAVASKSQNIPTTDFVTVMGKAKIFNSTQPVTRVAIGDPKLLDVIVISPNQLYFVGKSFGSTNVIFWYGDGSSRVQDVNILVDVKSLREAIQKQLPNEKELTIDAANGAVVLSGTVSDTIVANTVLNMTNAHLRGLNRASKSDSNSTSTGSEPGSNLNNSNTRLIQTVNLMKIRDSQQVMLEVKIAEIRKDLMDQLGVGVNAVGNALNAAGDVRWSIINQASTGALGAASLFSKSGKDSLSINAEKKDALVKILAEPTIVALSGEEGSFLAGGKVLIPVKQASSSSGSTASLEEREYGVGLKFIPTVLDGGRINLKVAPEVSEISSSPLQYSTGDGTNAVIPSFTSRRVSTTVQLREGQSLIIGGLMSNNVTETIRAFPLLGEIPILGALFRSSDFVNAKTELVVVVIPTLAKATNVPPTLPTDNFIKPSRSEFLLEGKMEGRAKSNSSSTK